MNDYLLVLCACLSAATTLATVIVYERIVRDLRAEREELLDDLDLSCELLAQSVSRHPSTAALRRVP